jgi:hypothetical protein
MQFIEQKDVNILNFLPQKRAVFPRFKHTLWTAVVIGVTFSLFAVYPLLNIDKLKRSIVSYQADNKAELGHLQQAKLKLDNANGRYITTLKRPIVYQENQFSTPLLSLASKKLEGVWLYDILIDNSSQQIKILGRSIKASGLSEFLNFLNGLKAFSGNTFSVININSTRGNSKLSAKGNVMAKSAVNSANKKQFSVKAVASTPLLAAPYYNFEVDNRGRIADEVATSKSKVGARLIIPKPVVRRKITLS